MRSLTPAQMRALSDIRGRFQPMCSPAYLRVLERRGLITAEPLTHGGGTRWEITPSGRAALEGGGR